MSLEERKQIEAQVEKLNQRLKDSGIPQLRFDFECTLGISEVN